MKNILSLELLVILAALHLEVGCLEIVTSKCDPLKTLENVEVTCTHRNQVSPCNEMQLPGTIARYKCKPFYVPHNTKLNQADTFEIKCIQNGTWINLDKYDSFNCIEDCGKRLVNPKPLIVNGVATNITSWPWHVAIFQKVESEFHYICGGSIIRNGIVLTAAHCVSAPDGTPYKNPKRLYKIIAGAISSNYSENLGKEGVKLFEIRKVYISDNYDPKRDYNADIAIVHLHGEMAFDETLLPVCLPNNYVVDSNAVKAGKVVDVVGFGIDENSKLSRILKHGALQVMSNPECFNSLRKVLTEAQFCAGNNYGRGNFTTVCSGDSGGGLVYPSTVLQKYHLHGIVSTGDSHKDGTCKNYGVFTRVYLFHSWIRDILENIKGDEIRELTTNEKIPYKLQGVIRENGEILRVRFIGIPRDWDTKILIIEFVHMDIDPAVLLDNLDYTRGITSLNLTQVNFDYLKIQKRVRLEYLESFVLDILLRDENVFHVDSNHLYPIEITKEYIKSLIFFDKSYDEHPITWNLEEIVQLKTNIQLTINIFKLITIKHEEGIISLSQLPFWNEILENIQITRNKVDFHLKTLALNQVNAFNPIILLKFNETLQHLILSHVNFAKSYEQQKLSNIFKFLNNLQELRLIMPKVDSTSTANSEVLEITDLPLTLQHLTIANGIILTYNTSKEKELGGRFYFPALESFTCNFCILDENVVQNFHWIFKSLKRLTLKLTQDFNIKRVANRMDNLEWVLISNDDNESNGKVNPTKFNFYGIDNKKYNGTKHTLILRKQPGDIKFKIRRNLTTIEIKELDFIGNGQEYFWTSFYEYEILTRLDQNEITAMKTGHYKFNGTTSNPNEFQPIKSIPTLLQPYLKTLHFSNADIIPEVMFYSLPNCINLEEIIMIDVKLLGIFDNRLLELPKVKTYKMHRLRYSTTLSQPTSIFINDLDDIQFRSLIPFEEFIHKISENGQDQRVGFVDYGNRIYQTKHLNQIDMIYDNCRLMYLDISQGILLSALAFTDEILHDYNSTIDPPIKRLSVRNPRNNINYYYNINELIPNSVVYFNLDSNSFTKKDDDETEISSMLMNLTDLKDFRFVNNRYQDEDDLLITIDLADLQSNVEFIELNNVQLNYSDTNLDIRTDLEIPLKLVYLYNCIVQENLVENWSNIVPAINLVLINMDSTENILLNVLKSKSVVTEWIYVQGLTSNTPVYHQTGEMNYKGELEELLKGFGVNNINNLSSITLEKYKGKWKQMQNEDLESKFKKLGKLTSESDFGRKGCGSRRR